MDPVSGNLIIAQTTINHIFMYDFIKDTHFSQQPSHPAISSENPLWMGFGDSSLDFKLFVFSRELGDRLPLMHAVHQEILEALREHGIEIPFPQRDLHVRSVDKDIPMPGRAPASD